MVAQCCFQAVESICAFDHKANAAVFYLYEEYPIIYKYYFFYYMHHLVISHQVMWLSVLTRGYVLF